MSPEQLEIAKQIGLKHVKQISLELLEMVLVPALEDAAKKSATPLDDMAVAALKEPLKNALVEIISKI